MAQLREAANIQEEWNGGELSKMPRTNATRPNEKASVASNARATGSSAINKIARKTRSARALKLAEGVASDSSRPGVSWWVPFTRFTNPSTD